jgi:RHS repeat-associated protein
MAPVNKYLGASKEWNAQTGFYYFVRRYYDPNLQRWPNRDPIQEAGGLNLYAYVGNNPISGVDPLGLWNIWNPATWGVSDGIGTSLGNSLNPFDGSAGWSGFSLETSSEADAAFLDGINPFGNPLANAGLYDPCDKSLQASRHIGTATGIIELTLLTGGGISLDAAGAKGSTEALDVATEMEQATQEGQQIIQQEMRLEAEYNQAFAEVAKAEDSGANLEQIGAARLALARAYSAMRAFGESLGH